MTEKLRALFRLKAFQNSIEKVASPMLLGAFPKAGITQNVFYLEQTLPHSTHHV